MKAEGIEAGNYMRLLSEESLQNDFGAMLMAKG
jgi:hypothetical protein